MNNIVTQIGECSGCEACRQVCPVGAISMQADAEGFLYATVDEAICISCGKCIDICAWRKINHKYKPLENVTAYAVKHKDEAKRGMSRSGGMFNALADHVLLRRQGVVYGAGYGEHFAVEHKRITDVNDRPQLCGSKYVQSILGDTYTQVRSDLEAGRMVLFTGTPCQCAGLRKFLGRHYGKLFIVDIVCHGVPSPMVWQDFLAMREREYKGSATQVSFRNKEVAGWKAHIETVTIKDEVIPSRIYTNLFYANAVLRPCCYQCKFAQKWRVGDITLADFWGHETIVPGFHEDDKGLSLVLVNTGPGEAIMKHCLDDVDFIDVSGQRFRHINMKHPTYAPANRDQFWQDYRQFGFEYIAEKYARYKKAQAPAVQSVPGLDSKLISKIKNIFKR